MNSKLYKSKGIDLLPQKILYLHRFFIIRVPRAVVLVATLPVLFDDPEVRVLARSLTEFIDLGDGVFSML